MDLSRNSDGSPGNSSPFPLNTNMPKLGTVNTLQGSLGMDLSGILQAGLIHPVTGQIVNGSLRRDDAAMRRRRGRRKNVEGMDLIFLKERPLPTRLQVGQCFPLHMALMQSAQFVSWSNPPLRALLPLLQCGASPRRAGLVLEQAGANPTPRRKGSTLCLATLSLECWSPDKHYHKQLFQIREGMRLENMRMFMRMSMIAFELLPRGFCIPFPSALGSTQGRMSTGSKSSPFRPLLGVILRKSQFSWS